MLLVIGVVLLVWIGLCLLLVALCVSARRGDGDRVARASPGEPKRRRFRRRGSALS